MNYNTTCMITGHRDLPQENTAFIVEQLRHEVLDAIEAGYDHFLSGFARGADLLFARVVSEYKGVYPITLGAALPYRDRVRTKDEMFHRLLKACDSVAVVSEDYSPACFAKRNQWMVQQSSRVIAVYDGREKGGTAATLRAAKSLGREIHVIRL